MLTRSHHHHPDARRRATDHIMSSRLKRGYHYVNLANNFAIDKNASSDRSDQSYASDTAELDTPTSDDAAPVKVDNQGYVTSGCRKYYIGAHRAGQMVAGAVCDNILYVFHNPGVSRHHAQ